MFFSFYHTLVTCALFTRLCALFMPYFLVLFSCGLFLRSLHTLFKYALYGKKNGTKFIYHPGQTIWNKTEESSKAGQDVYFCVFFYCYCQSLISRRETGYYAMSPLIFEIFLIFSYFLRS